MDETPLDSPAAILSTGIHSLPAIKKAAYKFADRFFVTIDEANPGNVRVTFRPKPGAGNVETVVGDFANEVLDQDLRESLAAETQAVRNLILAQAFSSTSLLDPDGESADYRDDPLNIASSDHHKG